MLKERQEQEAKPRRARTEHTKCAERVPNRPLVRCRRCEPHANTLRAHSVPIVALSCLPNDMPLIRERCTTIFAPLVGCSGVLASHFPRSNSGAFWLGKITRSPDSAA